MSEKNLVKIKHPTAVSVCSGLELEGEALQLLTDATTPADYLSQLIEKELYPDAVRFLAGALPKREATWWACLSARKGLNENSPATDTQAVQLAEAWVYKPTDENRTMALAAAEATRLKTAAGWAAMAAFWSGGNISPVEGTVVPPADELSGKAVVGAVMLAAVQNGPEHVKGNYQCFLKQGLDIAAGGDGRSVQ